MRIKIEQYEKDVIVHYYNRTSQGRTLFYNFLDYEEFLRTLYHNTMTMGANVHAYCLMPNHYHLLLQQTGETPLYQILQRIMTSYAQHFNARHNQYGKLFASKLNGKIVNRDDYLYNLIMYIHLNPVSAKIVKRPEDYTYSDYNIWIGERVSDRPWDDQLRTYFFRNAQGYYQTVNEYLYRKNV